MPVSKMTSFQNDTPSPLNLSYNKEKSYSSSEIPQSVNRGEKSITNTIMQYQDENLRPAWVGGDPFCHGCWPLHSAGESKKQNMPGTFRRGFAEFPTLCTHSWLLKGKKKKKENPPKPASRLGPQKAPAAAPAHLDGGVVLVHEVVLDELDGQRALADAAGSHHHQLVLGHRRPAASGGARRSPHRRRHPRPPLPRTRNTLPRAFRLPAPACRHHPPPEAPRRTPAASGHVTAAHSPAGRKRRARGRLFSKSVKLYSISILCH